MRESSHKDIPSSRELFLAKGDFKMRFVFKWVFGFFLLILCASCSFIPQASPLAVISEKTSPSSSPNIPSIPSPTPSTPANHAGVERTIQVGNTQRTYHIIVPQKYSGSPIPLVLFLHGRGGNAPVFEGTCAMSRKAEEVGFILIYPEALGDPAAWNAGFNRGRLDWVDDVSFIRELIASLRSEFAIDPLRIYVGGYSSGGIMSYRLATELADTVAAFGVMAGTIGARLPDGGTSQIPEPKVPVSIVHIHGIKDNVVPYDGYNSTIVPSDYFSAPRSVQYWVENDKCNPNPARENSFSGQLIKETYSGCKDGKTIAFYTLPSGDHTWPTSANPIQGQKISASDLMWEFFQAHPRLSPAP